MLIKPPYLRSPDGRANEPYNKYTITPTQLIYVSKPMKFTPYARGNYAKVEINLKKDRTHCGTLRAIKIVACVDQHSA